jgi:hypothetical protein
MTKEGSAQFRLWSHAVYEWKRILKRDGAGELTSDEHVPATGLWATETMHSFGRMREVNH